MKHRLLYTLGIIVLSMVAFATSPAEAETIAQGPYYAWPSWDQTLACTTTANCPRFIVLSNMGSAAVLDRETGLVWQRSPSTSPMDWASAHSHCTTVTVGNRKGWRLPTVQELASLDSSVGGGGADLPSGHPFSIVSFNHWSATTDASNTSYAWVVISGYGISGGGVKSFSGLNAWCVRGGQGGDPQ